MKRRIGTAALFSVLLLAAFSYPPAPEPERPLVAKVDPTFANIDGLESNGKGGYIVSDWSAGKILQVSAKGAVHQVAQFAQGTADIAYVPATHLLIIPHMPDNKISEYDISDAIQ